MVTAISGSTNDVAFEANNYDITANDRAIRAIANGVGGNIHTGIEIYSSGATENFGVWAVADKNYFSGNVGIGTTGPNSKLQVTGGDIYTSTAANGLIVKSPDGLTCRRVGIDNTGALTLTPVACP